GIQGSQVHFDLVCGARENGRAAAGTEKPSGVVACFAIDRHRILREHRGSVEKGPMMLTAVETVTKADPVGSSRRHKSDVAAQATARESVRPLLSLHPHSPAPFCLTICRARPTIEPEQKLLHPIRSRSRWTDCLKAGFLENPDRADILPGDVR